MDKAEILAAAIIKEGQKTGYWEKLQFWSEIDVPTSSGYDQDIPDLDSALKRIGRLDKLDPEIRVLLAAAGNFIWGKEVSALSPKDQARIAEKQRKRIELSLGERLWVATSQVDTDMF